MAEQPIGSRARFRTLASESGIPIEVDDLIALARRYADQAMYDESIHLYEMAEKLKPGSVALKINLARVRDLKQAAEETRFKLVRREVGAERARDEIDASQYVGLAQYYMAKDQTSKAIELLEISKLKTPNNYRPFEILGRLYFSQGEWNAAHEEIRNARKLNPFDRGLAELAGRVEFELKNFKAALEDFVDAFLLATDQKGESTEPVRRMINTLKRIENIETKELNALIKDRVENLQMCTERLEFRKENLFKLESRKDLKDIFQKITRDNEKRDNLITISADLRKLQVFQHIRDEQIFRLSKFTRVQTLASGEYVFREEERSMDFYIVKDGRIEIRKETPFGPQILGALGPDTIFGEMNFIDRTHRSSDGLATEPSACYIFSFSALDQMMDEDKEIAVGLHWAFWRSLAEKGPQARRRQTRGAADHGQVGGQGRSLQGAWPVRGGNETARDVLDGGAFPRRVDDFPRGRKGRQALHRPRRPHPHFEVHPRRRRRSADRARSRRLFRRDGAHRRQSAFRRCESARRRCHRALDRPRDAERDPVDGSPRIAAIPQPALPDDQPPPARDQREDRAVEVHERRLLTP
jgi:tetratricopeptide (TPR) repeat protein